MAKIELDKRLKENEIEHNAEESEPIISRKSIKSNNNEIFLNEEEEEDDFEMLVKNELRRPF